MASATSFAFAALLTREPAGAAGCIQLVPGARAAEADPTPEHFALALAARRPLQWAGTGGTWSLEWAAKTGGGA
jgi:hypothetical protein